MNEPSVLVSYHYWREAQAFLDRYVYRDWVLDSGAYSALTQGITIDVNAYADFCLEVMASDNPPVEIFSLDVIGDADGTMRNTEVLRDAGVPAIPAYHPGEPVAVLHEYARRYDKIALGGVAKKREQARITWARECVARIWPHKVHAFGFSGRRALLSIPFHSADASTWGLAPGKFKHFTAYNQRGTQQRIPVPNTKQNLRPEVENMLALESRLRQRWRKAMAQVGEHDDQAPSLRLAVCSSTETTLKYAFTPK